MSNMIRGLIKEGVVKNFFRETYQEEIAYLKRFKIFEKLLYPTYIDYKKYQENSKPFNEKTVRIIKYIIGS